MGKRKLHKVTFFQCDWTGYPMRKVHCFFPEWNENGKLLKRGSFCNWEAVAAYAHETCSAETLPRVMEFLQNVTGAIVRPAPHYTLLNHVRGTITQDEFHHLCTTQGAITGLVVMANGTINEVELVPDLINGRIRFDSYINRDMHDFAGLQHFNSMRKKGAPKQVERDLTIFYHPDRFKQLAPNPVASNYFKMQLTGDVLLVQKSREESFMPRERFVSFTREQFNEHFCKKRKRVTDVASLTPEQYGEIKQMMQASLHQVEQQAAQDAVIPSAKMKVAKMVHAPLASHVKAR